MILVAVIALGLAAAFDGWSRWSVNRLEWNRHDNMLRFMELQLQSLKEHRQAENWEDLSFAYESHDPYQIVATGSSANGPESGKLPIQEFEQEI